MKVLVLGGGQFVGRAIATEMLRAGHAVTLLNRGRSRDGLSDDGVERLQGDRDAGRAGLAALGDRTWDACVDVSGYSAVQVRASAEHLRDRIRHYVFVSAVAVYGDPPAGPVREGHPRVTPAAEDVTEVKGAMYARLKVTCEDLVEEIFAERCAVLRPQIVAGPRDPFDRFSYWVRRAGEDGPMLAPGDGSDFLQVIDVHDCAWFARIVCEEQLAGAFNLAGPRLAWTQFMEALGAHDIVWVGRETLDAAGVSEHELPLYRSAGSPRSALMHVSSERAQEAGLVLTETAQTIEDVRSWLPECDLAPAMPRDREAELIAMAR